jgi:hypothetical protein
MNAMTTARKKRGRRLREAVAGLFSDQADQSLAELRRLTEWRWRKDLRWLDASGMALYLIDRLIQLGAEDVIPHAIRARLKQNLADNRNRSAQLFDEMCAINRCFDENGIRFANLKGMTLCPESVPDPALRCQLDLDFLSTTDQATHVQQVMESMGYRLHGIGDGTWEFKAGASPIPSRKNMYKARSQRCAEVHFVDRHADGEGQRPSTKSGQLQRARVRSVCGTPMPTLSSADQLLNQALHLYGHLRGEFTRTSWGLEFARHLRTHRDHPELWQQVKRLADEIPQANIALGLTILVVEDVFGPCAPPALRLWTVDTLPEPVTLWASLYGRETLLGTYPGTKLYLLLQDALSTDEPRVRTSPRSKLLPRWLPPMVTKAERNESIATTLTRYTDQAVYLFRRTRFHILSGVRYSMETRRWRRLKNALNQRPSVLAREMSE